MQADKNGSKNGSESNHVKTRIAKESKTAHLPDKEQAPDIQGRAPQAPS
jgi:hypothetical protein